MNVYLENKSLEEADMIEYDIQQANRKRSRITDMSSSSSGGSSGIVSSSGVQPFKNQEVVITGIDRWVYCRFWF